MFLETYVLSRSFSCWCFSVRIFIASYLHFIRTSWRFIWIVLLRVRVVPFSVNFC